MPQVSSVPKSAEARTPAPLASLEETYDAYFPFVWRSVQRLGVPASHADDAVQEVFLVVHRKLPTFEGRSSLKTWLYGIALRVARGHRSLHSNASADHATDVDAIPASARNQPDARMANAEAARTVNAILGTLAEEQREVFVLAELEQLSSPEIAEALGVKLNTVYSRLRLAREAFANAAALHRARDEWRFR